jgi:hypothetical protein
MRWRATILAAAMALGAAACGADFWAFESIQTGPNPHTTLVIVWLADSPVDSAENLWVTLDGVDAVTDDGTHDLSDRREQHDLLALVNGSRVECARARIPSGRLRSLVLRFAPGGTGLHRIRVGGVTRDLAFAFPSDAELEVPLAADLPADGTVELHVDLNARASVLDAGGSWYFTPRAFGVEASRASWFTGTVLDDLGAPVAGATVSAQAAGEEVASTRAASDGRFVVGPLPPGTYAVVATAAGHHADALGPLPIGAGATHPGVALVLDAAGDGSVGGTVAAPGPGLSVWVFGAHGFLGRAGVDPVTGHIGALPLAPGVYRLELRDAFGLRASRDGVVVTTALHTDVAF